MQALISVYDKTNIIPFAQSLAESSVHIISTGGTQKLLTENMFAKHIVLILLIYFTVDLTSDKIHHPMDTLKSTVELWVFYILFTNIFVKILTH